MVFSLAACSENSGNNHLSDVDASKSEHTENNTSTNQNINNNSTTSDVSKYPQTGNNSTSSENNSLNTAKILVAYFSATNTTEGVAKNIADSLDADLYEITPKEPYTNADLDYHNDKSRSTIEMNDSNSRPAISGSVENMSQYEIVFIGYPIWWGEAPRILSTFIESYNFSGKTIVPFCTSGGSGVGSSAKNIERLTDKAT